MPPAIASISELSFSPGEIVAQVHTFDQTMIVFVTREDFRFYGVDRGHSIREKGRKRHLIRNLAEDYLSCWVTPVYIAVYRKFSMSIFLLSEDGDSFNEVIKYPNSYFGLEEFTKIKAFNAWKGKLFMKVGPQDVFELSLASPRNPEWRRITLKKRSEEIYALQAVMSGNGLAVFFEGHLEIVSLTTFKSIKIFTLPEGRHLINYESNTNKLAVISTSGIVTIIATEHPFKRSSIDLPPPVPYSSKMCRTGTPNLLYLRPHELIFLQLNTLESTEKLSLPAQFDPNTSVFEVIFRLSSIVQVNSLKDDTVSANFLWVGGHTDISFCHKSCKGSCEYPFSPCSQMSRAVFSIFLGIVIVGAAMTGVRICTAKMEAAMITKSPYSQRTIRLMMRKATIEVTSNPFKKFKVQLGGHDLTPSLLAEADQDNIEDLLDSSIDVTRQSNKPEQAQ